LAYLSTASGIDARNELALHELPQVYYIAARISERLPRSVDMQDLVQAGVIGLLEACRTFNEGRDAQFSTFAKFRIRGAILDSLRKLDWGSRALRRRGREMTAAIAKLEATFGRQPSEEEIAAEMGMELDELHSTISQLDGLYLVGQQIEPRHDSGRVEDLIESAPSDGREDPFNLYAAAERNQQLAEAVGKLSEREQLILSLYYREELTMKEIAQVVGIAISRVSQIHAAVLAKLRGSLTHLNEERPKATEARAPREAFPAGKGAFLEGIA
jgi:RNA polymerase sigma factor for flagellar operon FliA